jgi:hypothetical protein
MISESSEFNKIKATVMRAVRLSERPPAFVFVPNYRVAAFVEFDQGLTAKFWRLAQSLASAANDPNVFVLALEPDAENYFHKEFGTYGALQLSVNDTADSYVERLGEHPQGWPVDSLKYNSEYLVWASDSGRWLAWGSRGFSFIAVAFQNDFSPSLSELAKQADITLFSRDAAVSSLILPSFQDATAAQTFVSEFRRNYL